MTLKAKENKFGHFSNINLIVMRKHNSIFAWFKTLKVGSEPSYLLSLSFFFSGKFKVALKHLLRLPHSWNFDCRDAGSKDEKDRLQNH